MQFVFLPQCQPHAALKTSQCTPPRMLSRFQSHEVSPLATTTQQLPSLQLPQLLVLGVFELMSTCQQTQPSTWLTGFFLTLAMFSKPKMHLTTSKTEHPQNSIAGAIWSLNCIPATISRNAALRNANPYNCMYNRSMVTLRHRRSESWLGPTPSNPLEIVHEVSHVVAVLLLKIQTIHGSKVFQSEDNPQVNPAKETKRNQCSNTNISSSSSRLMQESNWMR